MTTDPTDERAEWEGGPPDDNDDLDVYVVSIYGGVVHRWDCDRRTGPAAATAAWTPTNSGLDDRPCPTCLPDGLPA